MQTPAIVFPEINKAVLETIDLPPMRPTDALVDVELSGVSVGTELWALTGQRPPGDTTFPCVPGYQAVGVVREAGPEAALKPGERCLLRCARLPEPYSKENWMGSHVGTAVIDAAANPTVGYWLRLPVFMKAEEAVYSAMASVAERGIELVGVNPGDLCVILGQGVIGQAAAQIARLRGADTLGVDILPARLELSARYSALDVLNALESDVGEEVRNRKPRGADVVIEASGNKKLIPKTIELVRELGRILLDGWYPGEVAFNFHDFHLRRPTIAITCGFGRDSNERVLYYSAEGKIQLAPLITHTFRPEQATEAYAMMRDRPNEFLGVAFDWRQ